MKFVLEKLVHVKRLQLHLICDSIRPCTFLVRATEDFRLLVITPSGEVCLKVDVSLVPGPYPEEPSQPGTFRIPFRDDDIDRLVASDEQPRSAELCTQTCFQSSLLHFFSVFSVRLVFISKLPCLSNTHRLHSGFSLGVASSL